MARLARLVLPGVPYHVTQLFGELGAADYANAYENSAPNPPQEQRMDLHNNLMGRMLAKDQRMRSVSRQRAFEKALKSGCLQTDPEKPVE